MLNVPKRPCYAAFLYSPFPSPHCSPLPFPETIPVNAVHIPCNTQLRPAPQFPRNVCRPPGAFFVAVPSREYVAASVPTLAGSAGIEKARPFEGWFCDGGHDFGGLRASRQRALCVGLDAAALQL